MTYQTSLVSVNIDWGNAVGGQKQLDVRARAQCYGRQCTPANVFLLFSVSGGSDIQFTDRSLELTADGETFQSDRGPDWIRNPRESAPAVGVVAAMQVPFSGFRTIARSEEVTGRLGSRPFEISHAGRAAFRSLVQRITTGEPVS